MRNMSRILSLLLAAIMLFALVSCGGDNDTNGNDTGKNTGSADETTAAPADEFSILEENFGAEDYAIGFRRDDNALTLRVQEILDGLVADGSAGEISGKWFGSDVMLRDKAFPREITDTGDNSLQYILDKGTLVLGLDETFPPMGFRDKNGDIVGFDIDLAKAVCAQLGVELVLQPIKWSAKEMELNGKNIDCIWNGMSVDAERAENMNLSKPYIANTQIIIVKSGSGITDIASLAGKNVAAQEGSTAVGAITEEAKATFGSLTEYSSNDDAFLDLKIGRIDALVVDEVYGRYLVENDG